MNAIVIFVKRKSYFKKVVLFAEGDPAIGCDEKVPCRCGYLGFHP